MATDEVHVGMLAQTVIKMHLTMLQDLQSSARA